MNGGSHGGTVPKLSHLQAQHVMAWRRRLRLTGVRLVAASALSPLRCLRLTEASRCSCRLPRRYLAGQPGGTAAHRRNEIPLLVLRKLAAAGDPARESRDQ